MSIANLCSWGTSKELMELGKPMSERRAADWRVPPCASAEPGTPLDRVCLAGGQCRAYQHAGADNNVCRWWSRIKQQVFVD